METKVLNKAKEVSDEKGNRILVSRQLLTQESGNTSEHIVIEKYKVSSTGVPQGKSKSFWMPVALTQPIINAINSLNSK